MDADVRITSVDTRPPQSRVINVRKNLYAYQGSLGVVVTIVYRNILSDRYLELLRMMREFTQVEIIEAKKEEDAEQRTTACEDIRT